ncbi:alcohol dehydrogenase [Cinnamomum micranthum f. kanehirae]|uniref:Alcohol dehydrogenase n=1 Tax=Cinnamomum micranthum f. kanehirae TaxID=337451 RepID=A0A443NJ92_9MAGN|nr:alcohol dehydrogenase [Cinnamomum micranthum f. kanehirae]
MGNQSSSSMESQFNNLLAPPLSASLGTTLNVAKQRVQQLLLLDGSCRHCRVSLSLVPVLVIMMCISVIINRFGLCFFSSSKKCTGNTNALISALMCSWFGCCHPSQRSLQRCMFRTHPMNVLNKQTLKGTFSRNYKPRFDLTSTVENA